MINTIKVISNQQEAKIVDNGKELTEVQTVTKMIKKRAKYFCNWRQQTMNQPTSRTCYSSTAVKCRLCSTRGNLDEGRLDPRP